MIDRRTAIRNVVGTGLGLSMLSPAQVFAADDPYLRYVHPELRAVAANMLKSMGGGAPTLTAEMLPRWRAGAEMQKPTFAADVPYERRALPGGKGQPEVSIFVINSKPGQQRPAILHMHGGGFVIGSAASEVKDVQALCQELDCAAVSVEYRLAPETNYVGSIEDNYTALKWLYRNAVSLGVDPARIAVMGGSAGGGHAALLAIKARDRGEIPIAFQCLTFPMLDDRTGSSRQPPAHVGKMVWSAPTNKFAWKSFLGQEPGGSRVPAAAVPSRVTNLTGLPPAFIGVGSIDLFHDEDVDYAQRLNDAAVPTELIVVPGAFHGFDGAGKATQIVRWFDGARKDALRRGLGIAAPAA